jgi:branched-chain amino acid transport system permease protein
MDNSGITSKEFLLPGGFLIILILLVILPFYVTDYIVILLTEIFMYITLTLSWTIFSGPTHYISLASAAFFGVGIYTSAILGKALPLPIVISIGGLASFCLALLVGALTLRLRGMYFAIFTFGLIELIRHFVIWWEVNITGTVGRLVIAVDYATIYRITVGISMILLLTAYLIRHSKFGLALQGIGEDEEATAHTGVNVNVLKTITFAISAFFMGATGAIMATRWTYIDPSIAFNPLYSFVPVLMAMFGGMGQLYGPILGAAVLTYIEELLTTRFPYYYMLLFGSILVVVIMYLPSGLVGLLQKLSKRSSRVQYANP